MWALTPLHPGGETYYLLPGREYTVGRKNCDLPLPGDQSISRSHAQLTVTDQTLTLKDTSKYGTFVNSQQLTAPVELSSGDNVTFGVFHSKFTVVFLEKPVVCSSCLDVAGKTWLSQALSALGGKLVNAWTQDCTHLAMPTVKVTIKTISALLCCRPIVKPEYFTELSSAVQQKSAPPKAERYIPEIDEPSLNKEDVKLATTPVRKQLFTGKTFVFLTNKQLKRLSAAVSFGGGRSQLLEEGSLPRHLLESPHSCVVEVTTGSSQSLLPASATEWANSVKNIIHRKGLRLITESEIGLAAIYASCDKYCNPSFLITDFDPAPTVKPRIPSASLSQSATVDETVLPAASQNITAYAVNTETSQRMAVCHVTGVAAVGETPEKKQNQSAAKLPETELVTEKTTTQSIVEDTVSSSLSAAGNAGSQRRKPDPKLKGLGNSNLRPPPSAPWTNGGSRTFLHKQSPQKPRTSAQTSPQKQSTLTNFFQPVNKKRPLEEDSSPVMSAPKRPAPESTVTSQDTNSPRGCKETLTLEGPPAVSETPLESAEDLVAGQSQVLSEETRSRKRKETQEEIKLDELESIMSMDMDCLDDELPSGHGQKEQLTVHGLAKQKQGSLNVESSAKRQRVHLDQSDRVGQRPDWGLEKERPQQNHREQSIKTERVHHTDSPTPYHHPSKPPKKSAASAAEERQAFEEDEASFIEDVELLQVDIPQPAEETKASVKPVKIKEEAQDSKIDEDLPKQLLMVEFRSLTVTAPAKRKPKPSHENGHVKNFKCFRKKRLPGAEDFPHVIGGADLLVHNRGKNSDLDEWLKDAAEEERLTRRDETMGDDLFRYNPSKLTKRR